MLPRGPVCSDPKLKLSFRNSIAESVFSFTASSHHARGEDTNANFEFDTYFPFPAIFSPQNQKQQLENSLHALECKISIVQEYKKIHPIGGVSVKSNGTVVM